MEPSRVSSPPPPRSSTPSPPHRLTPLLHRLPHPPGKCQLNTGQQQRPILRASHLRLRFAAPAQDAAAVDELNLLHRHQQLHLPTSIRNRFQVDLSLAPLSESSYCRSDRAGGQVFWFTQMNTCSSVLRGNPVVPCRPLEHPSLKNILLNYCCVVSPPTFLVGC